MDPQARISPWWAVLTVWGIVNMVNLLQSAGFLSRVITGSYCINHLLGYGIVMLSIPAIITLVVLMNEKSGWRHWIGLVVFLAFVVFMILVEYVWKIEFRNPKRYDILVPYLVLFFGSIFLMGVPMFRMDRRLWLVTVTTTVLLLGAMGYAMYMGVG